MSAECDKHGVDLHGDPFSGLVCPVCEREAESEGLRERMARAQAVAEYWRDAAMERGAEAQIPWRVMAHPLACTLAALLGDETEPDQLGIPQDEFDTRYPLALAALAPTEEPVPEAQP